MNTDILTHTENIIKWVVVIDPTTDLTGIPDGIYPFNGLIDQWAVVIGEMQVNWSSQYGVACLMYAEALRVNREHVQRCPGDIPYDGIALRAYDNGDFDNGLSEPTL